MTSPLADRNWDKFTDWPDDSSQERGTATGERKAR